MVPAVFPSLLVTVIIYLINIMQYKRYFELSYSCVMVDADWETFSGSDLKAFWEGLGVRPAVKGIKN